MPKPANDRPLYYSAFVMNTPSHVIHGLWRDPEAANHEINSLSHWVELARYLDGAGYDQMFFADVTGLRSPWNGSYELVAEQGMQIPTNDPSVLISALATATENLGLVYTSSIAQSLPFDFARRISTLDHYTDGRVGWNIVTSFSDNTYRNFGHDKLIEHDLRYEIAEEYVDVAYKLWEGSWDEDALRADKQAGVHADPSKIHKINHVGPHYSVEGPHFVTPSPQRTPVLFQAGASPVGQRFAARNAEGVFISSPDPESARGLIDETRELAAGYGRDPYDVKFFQGLSLIVGRTSDEAREKEAKMEELVSLEGVLCHILGDAGIDAGALPLDTPLSDLGEFRGIQGWARWAGEACGDLRPHHRRPGARVRAQQPDRGITGGGRRQTRGVARRGDRRGERVSRRTPWDVQGHRGESVPRTAQARAAQRRQVRDAAAQAVWRRCRPAARRRTPRRSTAARSPTTRWPTGSPSR